MSPKNAIIGLVLVLLSCHEAMAQSGCTSVLISLSSCLNYVTGSSSTPSSSCCSKLASVVQSQPQCLCSVVNGGSGASSLGVTVNQTLAVSLPGACNVQTPSISRCNNAEGPASSTTSPVLLSPLASPTSPPADITPQIDPTSTSTAQPNFQSGVTGSKTILPTTDNNGVSNNGGTFKVSLLADIFILFFALTSVIAL
ncbi:non-specific lipid transfer protein GPI-anchored 5-like [Humulus lupulus]|uniref:non-specific lipid transfer protein GPI-anchored 5-like n=1 Tax=Humulus lupulus TaxID=3486 RepID=UPI002B407202|nr:non-specific lipid transfer protein GPI-anchored 5-like [Humulus lupulus]